MRCGIVAILEMMNARSLLLQPIYKMLIVPNVMHSMVIMHNRRNPSEKDGNMSNGTIEVQMLVITTLTTTFFK